MSLWAGVLLGAFSVATVTAVAWTIAGAGASGVATSGIVFGVGFCVGGFCGARMLFKLSRDIVKGPTAVAVARADKVSESHALGEAVTLLRKYDKYTALLYLEQRWSDAKDEADEFLFEDDLGPG